MNAPPSNPVPEDVRNGGSSKKTFSCVLCAQRKVKCDRRQSGCENCAKARVPCIYKAPPAPRRRKKGVRDVELTTRVRVYEDALRELGVDPGRLVDRKLSTSPAPDDPLPGNGILEFHSVVQHRKFEAHNEVGVLVSQEGKSRYLENGIWTSLKGEFRESKEILDEHSEDDSPDSEIGVTTKSPSPHIEGLLFGQSSTSAVLGHLHPTPVQIFQLWQMYLDNINPLVKLFHAPTVQQIISDASGHLDDLPRNVEALLFAIYCITIESLSDGDCIGLLGQHKDVLSKQLRAAAQCALTNTNLLRTSDTMVLQAFTLFILSLQNYDARVIWHLAGIAQRIGQRIGLHRDAEKLQLPPFEVEIRRRLWWQIMMLEGYAQKLAGTGTASTILMGDVKMPANVNDSDICPGMESPPAEHTGATEMMFFLIRCHSGTFLMRAADSHTSFDGVWHRMSNKAISLAIKDKAIDELEELFRSKFLQYCDTSIPWHFMCKQLGQAIIFMMRFIAHSTEYHRLDANQAEKDELFKLALRVISAQNLAYTMREMQGFMWHVNLHFQWKAFIYLVGELRHRTEGEDVEKAWKEVSKSYEFHPSFDKELARRALPIAVSNLTLKAWESHVAVRGIPANGEPYFIQVIRRNAYRKAGSSASGGPTNGTYKSDLVSSHPENIPNDENIAQSSENGLIDFSQIPGWNTPGAGNLSTFEINGLPVVDNIDGMDWSNWDSLFVDFQTHEVESPPDDLSTFSIGRLHS